VIREEHIAQLKQRNTIRLSMAPPLLVMEIVSPGEVQRNRDYVAKRSQYEAIGIPEYWLVDPQAGTILILTVRNGQYEEAARLQGTDAVRSPQLGDLKATVAEVFAAA
jgi:Uma2 family endonuclease